MAVKVKRALCSARRTELDASLDFERRLVCWKPKSGSCKLIEVNSYATMRKAVRNYTQAKR